MKPQLSILTRCAFCLSLTVTLNSCQSLSSQLTTNHHPQSEPGMVYLEPTDPSVASNLELKPVRIEHRFGVPAPCQPLKKPNELQLVQWQQHQVDPWEQNAVSSDSAKTQVAPPPPVEVQFSPLRELISRNPADHFRPIQDCLPNPAEMEAIKSSGPSPLELEVDSLKHKLDKMTTMMQRLEKALAASNEHIDKLQHEVDLGKGEVTAIRQTMRQQHAADLRILTRLSDKLGELVTAGQEETPVLEPFADSVQNAILR